MANWPRPPSAFPEPPADVSVAQRVLQRERDRAEREYKALLEKLHALVQRHTDDLADVHRELALLSSAMVELDAALRLLKPR